MWLSKFSLCVWITADREFHAVEYHSDDAQRGARRLRVHRLERSEDCARSIRDWAAERCVATAVSARVRIPWASSRLVMLEWWCKQSLFLITLDRFPTEVSKIPSIVQLYQHYCGSAATRSGGNCQRNNVEPSSAASGVKISPPAAVHPITGGIAPTTAPAQVFRMCMRFIGV
eukprot:SAG31_NODE_8134_length_1514_cov_1.757597_2_plen_173_part_00